MCVWKKTELKGVQKQIAKPVPLMEFCHHVKNINEKLGLPDELPNITNVFTSDVYLAMEPRKQSFQNEKCKVIAFVITLSFEIIAELPKNGMFFTFQLGRGARTRITERTEVSSYELK